MVFIESCNNASNNYDMTIISINILQCIIYHLEKVDGTTPMYSFIMAPYEARPSAFTAVHIPI